MEIIIMDKYANSRVAVYKKTEHTTIWHVKFWDKNSNKVASKHFTNYDEATKFSFEKQISHEERFKLVELDVLIDNFAYYSKWYRIAPPKFKHVDFQEITIDPYFLGLWLGDGNSSWTQITSVDNEILEYCKQYATSLGLDFLQSKTDKITYALRSLDNVSISRRKIDAETFRGILKRLHEGESRKTLAKEFKVHHQTLSNMIKNKEYFLVDRYNPLLKQLHYYNLFRNKHIPRVYIENDKEVRMKLLAGLIDSDGYLDKGTGYEIVQKNRQLSLGIIELAKSLGYTVTSREVFKRCTNSKKENAGSFVTRIYIRGANLSEIPVLLERKRANKKRLLNYYDPLILQDLINKRNTQLNNN